MRPREPTHRMKAVAVGPSWELSLILGVGRRSGGWQDAGRRPGVRARAAKPMRLRVSRLGETVQIRQIAHLGFPEVPGRRSSHCFDMLSFGVKVAGSTRALQSFRPSAEEK